MEIHLRLVSNNDRKFKLKCLLCFSGRIFREIRKLKIKSVVNSHQEFQITFFLLNFISI